MHYRYYSTKLQVFQEYLAPRRVLVLIQVGVASLYKKAGHRWYQKIWEFAIRRSTRRITQYTAHGGMRTRAVNIM